MLVVTIFLRLKIFLVLVLFINRPCYATEVDRVAAINSASSESIYWAAPTTGEIIKANPDGSNSQVIINHLLNPYGLASDTNSNTLYWTDSQFGIVQKMHISTAQIKNLVSNFTEPYALIIEIEPLNTESVTDPDQQITQEIYWIEEFTIMQGFLNASNDLLDSNILLNLPQDELPHGLAFDEENNRLFWGDDFGRMVQWIDLNTRQTNTLTFSAPAFLSQERSPILTPEPDYIP